ncbi:MAG: type II secretion system F family protein [Phycisphaerales bacterium]|nr:type II secretion system F family protein [Phycisphaerae bacterium]NNF44516.1 type II secretion system F family protein [Phycisphaerales bacterium]NNM24405.1 type II secretion system F family protein [Phycisphaerales bacterium]
MPTYQYQSLTTGGETRNGVLAAADRADAVRRLAQRGETPTTLIQGDASIAPAPQAKKKTPARTGAAAKSSTSGLAAMERRLGLGGSDRPSISRSELANLIRELATALEAGLPLMQSLKTVRRQAHGRALPVILDHLIDRVEAGDPLYMAAEAYGRPFDDMVLGMLRAADASGDMSEVLHQLADLLERSVELRREVMGATFYPAIVAALVVVSTVVLVTILVPRLIGPMAGEAGLRLPWPTQTVLGIANFLQAYWAPTLLGIVGIAFAWFMWSSVPANRVRIDRFKLRAPLLGRLLRDVSVARFTRTLGTLSAAGLPILDALRITRRTLGNAALMEAIEAVEDQVTAGKALADPLERSGLFPPLLVQVVSLGERSGRLDKMLMHAATAFDRQVNTSINLFTKALPPLLLIVMAGIGGFVLAAILLPLLELQNLVR